MRVIERNTIEAVQALYTGERTNPYWKRGNMIAIRAVDMDTREHVITVYLHGNAIIKLDCDTGEIQATLAGWDTVTTRSRLNAIIQGLIQGLDSHSFMRFWRKRGVTQAHIDGEDIVADHDTWYTVGKINQGV